jgi:chemotaxis protein MotB
VRKKRAEEHENLERWLITYADLITLLLAFFIMMYTFSKQDAQKYQEVSSHLRTIFTGGAGLAGRGSATEKLPIESLSKGASSGDIKRQLEGEMLDTNSKGSQENISIFSDERGIVIRVMDKTFFDEGKADLRDRAKKTLDRIVPTIAAIPNQMRVEGHTDNNPISTTEFKSNWELSVRRATEVVRYLVEKKGLAAARVSAAGYAEHRPVVANTSSENRALNRRIEIIIVNSGEKAG